MGVNEAFRLECQCVCLLPSDLSTYPCLSCLTVAPLVWQVHPVPHGSLQRQCSVCSPQIPQTVLVWWGGGWGQCTLHTLMSSSSLRHLLLEGEYLGVFIPDCCLMWSVFVCLSQIVFIPDCCLMWMIFVFISVWFGVFENVYPKLLFDEVWWDFICFTHIEQFYVFILFSLILLVHP